MSPDHAEVAGLDILNLPNGLKIKKKLKAADNAPIASKTIQMYMYLPEF